jgi:hypothetical protein
MMKTHVDIDVALIRGGVNADLYVPGLGEKTREKGR